MNREAELDKLLDDAYKLGVVDATLHVDDNAALMPKMKAKGHELIDRLVKEADSCPCLLVEPCSYACSCANPVMSGGCMRCCKHGSMEQRIAAATRIALLSQSSQEAKHA